MADISVVIGETIPQIDEFLLDLGAVFAGTVGPVLKDFCILFYEVPS